MLFRGALLGLLIAFAPSAFPATITVTTTIDELTVNGQCSLREAVRAANTNTAVDSCAAGSGSDTIVLAPGTYTLSLTGEDVDDSPALTYVSGDEASGDLDIRYPVTITGADAATTIIDGNQIDRILQVFSILTLDNVTLLNGNNASGADWGGCIRTDYGSVTINDSVLKNCRSALDGGAVFAYRATLAIHNSRFEGNSASGRGGAVAAYTGSTVTIADSTFLTNDAQSSGGGIYVSGYDAATTLTVSGSVVDGNTANLSGGGLYAYQTVVNVAQSSLTGNSSRAQGGGVYAKSSTVAITNSTLAGNEGSSGSAAYSDYANITLANCTVAFNARGTAIYSSSPSYMHLQNTIVANNLAAYYPNIAAYFDSQGYNLIGEFLGSVDATDIVGADPLLGPLSQDANGVSYYPLLPGSQAIDGGDPEGCLNAGGQPLTTDERNNARTVDGNNDGMSRCDIGAVEQAFAYGLTATPVADLLTTEQGNSTTIHFSLNSAPQNDVMVALSIDDATEGQVSSTSLTFTSTDWDVPQAVLVTGLDDALNDGNVSFQVVTGPLSSLDGHFDGVDPADIAVTNMDDEGAGVSVTNLDGSAITAPLEVSEAGQSVSTFFGIQLANRPVADVTISYRVSDETQGTFNPYGTGGGVTIDGLNYYQFTFTKNNWNVPLQIPVYAVNDIVDDGDVMFTIDFLPLVSDDHNYNAMSVSSIDVIALDDDEPQTPGTSGPSGGGDGGGGGGGIDWLFLLAGLLLYRHSAAGYRIR